GLDDCRRRLGFRRRDRRGNGWLAILESPLSPCERARTLRQLALPPRHERNAFLELALARGQPPVARSPSGNDVSAHCGERGSRDGETDRCPDQRVEQEAAPVTVDDVR